MRALLLVLCLQAAHGLNIAARMQLQPRSTAVRPPQSDLRAAIGENMCLRNFRTIGAAALASLVLVTSPMEAIAKGGGHGGGTGGGGHTSSFHSTSRTSSSSMRTLHSYHSTSRGTTSTGSARSSRSRRRSSGYSSSHNRGYSSSTAASPPPPVVLYPDKSAARRENGYYCPSNLPRPGERVYVEQGEPSLPKRTATVIASQPASQTKLYGKSVGSVLQSVPGFDEDCTVSVRYDDGMIDTVSAAQRPASEFAEFISTMAVPIVYGSFGLLSQFSDDGDDVWETAKELQEELLQEIASAREQPGGPPQTPPQSGEYWGCSNESDEGDQAVRTTLIFHRDGIITGRGIDGVDGSYRVTRGRWCTRGGKEDEKPTVAWTEVYDEGFEVAVVGRYDEVTARIEAIFTSSRGVRGEFALKPKPSVF